MSPGYTENDLEGSIPERFEEIVRRFPERLAVTSSRYAWTYSELNETANRVAHALLSGSGAGGAPIACLVGHDTPAIGCMMGILKAGKFYAFLDPSFPLRHNEAVLADLNPALLVCDRENLPAAAALANGRCSLLVYDTIGEAHAHESPGLRVTGRMPFGVFYTSGSTGQPKGVQRNHNLALHRYLMDTAEAALSPDDRQALITSLTYAGSSSDTYRALLNGASLHLYDTRTFGMNYFAEWLRQERITYLRPPVALFRHFLSSLQEEEFFQSTRVISLGGAAVFRHDIETARKHFPAGCRMIHRYSISEGGEVARLLIEADTELDGPIVPVGQPMPGKEVLILDDERRELPVGDVGEVAVRSRYLAAGYWARPEQTRKRYVPDPLDAQSVVLLTGDIGRIRSDGHLELLGRNDFRVKIRGFRVELTAVESALHELDRVRGAVVTSQTDVTGETCLVAYVVAESEQATNSAVLRSMLASRLPEHMLPSAFVFVDALPLTHGGKVDRQALPPYVPGLSSSARARQQPRTPAEIALAVIWSDVLKLDRIRIGVEDNFFDIGGHSLHAARAIARINELFDVNFLLRTLFDVPTIAGLAALIGDASGAKKGGRCP